MAAPGGAPLLAVATNPAIDRVARIDGPASGVVRAREALETPGGKAIHVAMVAAQLGAEAAVLTTAGGRDGELLLDLLAAEPLPAHPVRVDAETRGTYTVVGAGGDLLEVHEPSAALGGEECDRLVAELERLAPRRPIVAVCGSLPPGTDPDLHARLLGAARAAGCFAILDCSTPAALEPALAAGPDLVAPNLGEARRLLGSDRDGDPDDAELASAERGADRARRRSCLDLARRRRQRPRPPGRAAAPAGPGTGADRQRGRLRRRPARRPGRGPLGRLDARARRRSRRRRRHRQARPPAPRPDRPRARPRAPP